MAARGTVVVFRVALVVVVPVGAAIDEGGTVAVDVRIDDDVVVESHSVRAVQRPNDTGTPAT